MKKLSKSDQVGKSLDTISPEVVEKAKQAELNYLKVREELRGLYGEAERSS